MEASRPPASSNPSPLIKQASALPDFLSLHPTSPVITLCCIYLANLRAGPLSSLPVFWLILSSSRVKREARCSFLNICQKEPRHLQVLCALILPAVMQSLEMRFLLLWRGAELFKERSHPAGFLLRHAPPTELLKSYCERPQKLESEYFINPFRIQKEDETNTN